MLNITHLKFQSTLIEWSCQLVVALFYVLFSYITNKYLISHGIVSAIWLGSGVALSALLIGGWHYLWGVFFGMLAFNIMVHNSFIGVVGVTLANILEVILGFWLLSKKSVISQSMLHNYLKLILLGGGVASIVGSVIGALTLLLLGFIPRADYLKNVLTWWMGDTLGVVLLVPFSLVWYEKKLTRITRKKLIEGVLLVGTSFFVGQIIFLDLYHEFFSNAPKGYLMFFCISIVAIRMGTRGTTLVVIIVATQAMLSAYLKIGFFANEIAVSELRNYWLYILILSGVGVSLASYVDKVNQTMVQLQREIHDRKQIEIDLKNSEQKLAISNADLLQFTHIAAHHLQEPARRIVNFVQRLKNTLTNTPNFNDDVIIPLQFIEQSALRQRALVSDIQLYLVAIQPRAKVGTVDVADIISKVLDNNALLIHKTSACVEYSELPALMIDRPRLYDIFNVLLDNALHYYRPNSIPKIRIHGELKNGRVYYYVEDNGIGIPVEYRERVFLVFERLQVNKNQESTGIGLAIVRRIVESCGGTVYLTETAGGGTTVVFDLPAEIASIQS